MLASHFDLISLAIVILVALFSIFRFVNKKVSSVYTRFDKFKEDIKKEYVQKDMCKVIDTRTTADIKRLEAKIDTIITLLMEDRRSNDKG